LRRKEGSPIAPRLKNGKTLGRTEARVEWGGMPRKNLGENQNCDHLTKGLAREPHDRGAMDKVPTLSSMRAERRNEGILVVTSGDGHGGGRLKVKSIAQEEWGEISY